MNSNIEEFIYGVIAITVGIIFTVSLIVGFVFAVRQYERLQCNRLSQTASVATRFDNINGCYVKVNGRFIPRENWRGEYQQ